LRSEKKAGLRIDQRPPVNEVRENGAEHRGDDADDYETRVQQKPFVPQISRHKSGRSGRHGNWSVAQASGRDKSFGFRQKPALWFLNTALIVSLTSSGTID
jgi:hypothetical protein